MSVTSLDADRSRRRPLVSLNTRMRVLMYRRFPLPSGSSPAISSMPPSSPVVRELIWSAKPRVFASWKISLSVLPMSSSGKRLKTVENDLLHSR